ncbi:hypothetical protein, partial [Acinetobacter brisouii]|uniref:hypothetical protein n=1 Tax=Acinetobacter brisouii TaxID=396323 RepID=UPI001C07CEA6
MIFPKIKNLARKKPTSKFNASQLSKKMQIAVKMSVCKYTHFFMNLSHHLDLTLQQTLPSL